jgi:hypothetical protein
MPKSVKIPLLDTIFEAQDTLGKSANKAAA